ncbi:MAG: type IV toxin-antitoxin system AbiEi family antitoxin domain-containing protein [Sedimentisphaerales bacterium]|nr:type IV toxin-antitoxin system AbiEi family antitoxin domain-containing protein [Sedimentisphaerales bacterium]MBN2841515.1 type IV toxin-antitoxin system AbiEi family antitoxin domain-containing protein [Sedimentisphaerales bacterium]
MDADIVKSIIKAKGVVCASDLVEAGINRTMLSHLADKGILRRIARGVYTYAGNYMAYEAYAEVIARAPRGVICLLSALQFHEITTQMPSETWLAIERDDTRPGIKNTRLIRLSGKAFSEGIDIHEEQGLALRVYSPAKTVVDCFKFRNKIGLDIAREALTDTLGQKKATRDEIWKYAKVCRMTNVMRPYLEMIK